MNEPDQPPIPRLTPVQDIDDRTRALSELRIRLVDLNVQLEYLKLMLKLGVRR